MGGLFSSPQQTYVTPPLPDYVQNYLRAATGYLSGQIQAPGPPYPGPFIADITPQTSQGITDIGTEAAVASGLPFVGAPELAATVGGAYVDPRTNPYLAGIVGAISDVTNQQMQRYLQDVRQRYAAMGLGTSTPLLDEEARVLGAVMPQEALDIGNVLNQAYMGERQLQAQETPFALTFPADISGALTTAGQIPQATQQALYDAWRNEYLRLQGQQAGAAGQGVGLASLQAPQPASYGSPPILGLISGAANLFSALHPFGK